MKYEYFDPWLFLKSQPEPVTNFSSFSNFSRDPQEKTFCDEVQQKALLRELEYIRECYQSCLLLKHCPERKTFSPTTLKHEAAAYERMERRAQEIKAILGHGGADDA